jgi:hypothetical protein
VAGAVSWRIDEMDGAVAEEVEGAAEAGVGVDVVAVEVDGAVFERRNRSGRGGGR